MEGGTLGLILSFLAGISTTLGSLVVFCMKDYRVMPFAICMSFSAGVMMYVSLIEMFPLSQDNFKEALTDAGRSEEDANAFAYFYATLSLLGGYALTTLFDKFVHGVIVGFCGSQRFTLQRLMSKEKGRLRLPEAGDLDALELSAEEAEGETNRQPKLQKSLRKRGGEEELATTVGFPSTSSPTPVNEEKHDATANSRDAVARGGEVHDENNNNIGVKKASWKRLQEMARSRVLGQRSGLHEGSSVRASDELLDCAPRLSGEANDNQHITLTSEGEGGGAVARGGSVSSSTSAGIASSSASSSAAEAPPSRGDRKVTLVKKILMRSDTTESEKLAISMAEEKFKKQHTTFRRLGFTTAIALALHNFPEGIATFIGALAAPQYGVGVAIAVAIHNVPEGFAVAVPVYVGTGSKWKGFLYSFLSGLAEPLGAIIAWFFLRNTRSPGVFGALFGLIGGVMTNISMKELYPTAIRYDPADKAVTLSFFLAAVVMAASLVSLKFTTGE